MLTFGSLFAGIGGFDLGLERAGMACKWQVEINPFCQKVLAKHWPDVERYADVKECGKHNLETVDLIAGGFPCQPHSVAGKQRGAEDDRNLWPEYRRIVAELRPAWVLAENVPGIRRTMLDEVLSDLEGLAYSTRTLIVPACALDAPHRRERVFIIAHTASNLRRTSGNEGQISLDRGGQIVAHAESTGETATQQQRQLRQPKQGGENVADAAQLYCNGCNDNEKQSKSRTVSKSGDRSCTPQSISDWWTVEPNVGRVANGIPHRVDRLRALGNAVVPQVVEWIGRRIVEVDSDPAR